MKTTKKKIAFYTLGCKLNYAETESISRLFVEDKYQHIDFSEKADIYVINTCSVTEQANKKCKQIISKAYKLNPEAKLIVVGCFAQLKSEEIAQFNGVDLVLGTKEKFKIVEHLEQLYVPNSIHEKIYSCDIDDVSDFQSSFSLDGRTRSFLKVQDGCDYKCTYCTIPQARGKSRNSSISEIISNANIIADNGVKEIILTGINIGDFGQTTGESFFELICELENNTTIDRYRISSIEPNLLTDEILEFIATSKRFVPHFHIPLQSGSDEVLKLMKRRYSTTLFANRIEKIHSLMPNVAIGIDVIVGSPGETTDLFNECYSFLENTDFAYLHVFSYSPRENTEALNIQPKVSQPEKKRRSELLHTLSDSKKHLFYKKFVGTNCEVLFENKNNLGFISGFSNNYLRVNVPYNAKLGNTIKKCKLIDINKHCEFIGEVL